jgi:hypothetical protein
MISRDEGSTVRRKSTQNGERPLLLKKQSENKGGNENGKKGSKNVDNNSITLDEHGFDG